MRMLSKKTTNTSTTSRAPAARNKKKKAEATFEVSRFQDTIREQAYYTYLKRTHAGMPGDEITDWLEAEKFLAAKGTAH
jgi:hypothetical protein